MRRSFRFCLQVDDTQLDAAGTAYVTHTTYTYDARDRLTHQANPDHTALDYGYDANGNRTWLTATYPDGSTAGTTYTYDALNRLATVSGPEGTTTWAYDAAGRKTQEVQANGVSTAWTYNPRDAVTHLTSTTATGSVLRDDSYTVDALNRRTQVQEADGRQTVYGYDELGRLVSETQGGGSAAAYSAGYQYDAVGNRTQSVVNGDTVSYSYDANDRLLATTGSVSGATTYSYDANGSLLHKQSAANGQQYTYNARLRLLRSIGASGITDYLYDADGSRIGKHDGSGSTVYLVDSNRSYASVLAQLDGSSGARQAAYTLGNGTDRVTQATAGGFRFYLQDAHGNVRGLVDGNATPTQTYAYDAFGNALVTQVNANEAANDFRYTGEQLDGETGTYYLRARNYDPALGRFTQKDSWEGRANNPVGLNQYIYANGNPVGQSDPSGHFATNGVETAAAANINAALVLVEDVDIVGEIAFEEDIAGEGAANASKRIAPMMLKIFSTLSAIEIMANIDYDAVQDEIDRAREEYKEDEQPQGHHTIPMFMCGHKEQRLSVLPAKLHRIIHAGLSMIRTNIDANGSIVDRLFPVGRNRSSASGIRAIAADSGGRSVISSLIQNYYFNYGFWRDGISPIGLVFSDESPRFIKGYYEASCSGDD